MLRLFLRLSLLKIFFLAFSLYSMGHDENTGQAIINIEMDNQCLESCQHTITLFLRDGTKEAKTFLKAEIMNSYWPFLTEKQKEHLRLVEVQ